MKMIYKIAKNELQTLFFSPVAWLIIVIFLFQVNSAFSGMLESYAKRVELGDTNFSSLTTFFFNHRQVGIFGKILDYLYLYIPLLTMGLMSREISNGSIKLLYSSPITTTEIILGKFLSMMIYGLILIVCLGFSVVCASFKIETLDISIILSACLGTYLLLCAYAAIGIFMSSLTSYQIVAAIGTFIILAFFNYVGNLWQSVDIIRDITYWLSIKGRADHMIQGLIQSEDVLYFVIVVALFLSFTIIRLQGTRQKSRWYTSLSKYAAAILLAISLGFITSRPVFWLTHDATNNKRNTISRNSQEILKTVKDNITITAYVNVFDPYWVFMTPNNVNRDISLFNRFRRFKPRTKFNYIYYYHPIPGQNLQQQHPGLSEREIMKKIVEVHEVDTNMVLTPEQIRELSGKEMIDLSSENYRVFRRLTTPDGKSSILRFFDDMQRQPSEREISAAIRRLGVEAPVVGFLTGHNERNIERSGDRQYSLFSTNKRFRSSMLNQGFTTTEVSAEEPLDQVDILIIADPRSEFSENEYRHILEYIQKGGNLLIAGEPGRQHILNPLLAHLGVEMLPGRLMEPNEELMPDFIKAYPTPQSPDILLGFGTMIRYKYVVTMPGCAALNYVEKDGFRVQPVLASDENRSWNKLGEIHFMEDDSGSAPEEGEAIRSYPTMLTLNRTVGEKEQRIIVTGDADCLGNGELTVSRPNINADNYAVVSAAFHWMSEQQLPVRVGFAASRDTILHGTLQGAKVWKFILVWVLPFIIAAAGAVIWIRRRGR